MNWKIWLIAAGILVLVGCLLLAVVMSGIKWNFTKLATTQYETNRYEFSEAWEDLSIYTETANVILKPATDGKTSVVCCEQENAKHTVTVKDGTLRVAACVRKGTRFQGSVTFAGEDQELVENAGLNG